MIFSKVEIIDGEQYVNIDLLIAEQKENKQLKDNWNKLKEWLEDENNQQYSKYIYNYSINNWVLNKMQEIEGGMNE